MPMPGALVMAPFQSREKKPVPRPGTPSRQTTLIQGLQVQAPKTPQFARYKQKSGRGEGLIYNILGKDFQMRAFRPQAGFDRWRTAIGNL